MYYYKNKIGFVVLIMSVFSFALADSPKIKMSGWGYLTYGKIVKFAIESKEV
jgi:hypothetical protein